MSTGSEPHIGFTRLGVLHQEDEPPRMFGFEGQWGLLQESQRVVGIETLLLKGTSKI